MTDSHAQLEEWIVDGALGDPPRDIAVHASVCELCLTMLGAFDALALIDVGAAGSPPPLVAPTRLRKGVARARLATAVVGTVVAGILVVFGVSQLVGLGGPAGGPAGAPEGTELAGLSNLSDGAGPARSQDQSSLGLDATGTPTPETSETPQPGVTPGPLPSSPPGATARPPQPTPPPPPSVAPTPSPTPDPTPTSAPTPTPTPTAPGAPTSLTALPFPGRIDLSWTAPSDDGGNPITGYNVYRSEDNVTFALLGTVVATSYSDANVTFGLTYFYYVTAVNDFGESGTSDTAWAIAL